MDQFIDLVYYIVLILLELKYGYLIMQEIEEMIDDFFMIGLVILYILLKKLLQEEIIEFVNNDNLCCKVY